MSRRQIAEQLPESTETYAVRTCFNADALQIELNEMAEQGGVVHTILPLAEGGYLLVWYRWN